MRISFHFQCQSQYHIVISVKMLIKNLLYNLYPKMIIRFFQSWWIEISAITVSILTLLVKNYVGEKGTCLIHFTPFPLFIKSMFFRICLCISLFYILNTPGFQFGIGALSDAEMPSPSTNRVSTGSIIPSSHIRAVL